MKHTFQIGQRNSFINEARNISCSANGNKPMRTCSSTSSYILVVNESGVVGRCVASFWPLSGAPDEISVRLRTATGAIHKLPLVSVEKATDSERKDFLRKTRKS